MRFDIESTRDVAAGELFQGRMLHCVPYSIVFTRATQVVAGAGQAESSPCALIRARKEQLEPKALQTPAKPGVGRRDARHGSR